MAHYYVKAGGTALNNAGRYATRQTGSFASLGASGYYESLAVAFGGTFAGPTELCTNGGFATDLTGWTTDAGDGTVSRTNIYGDGELYLEHNSASGSNEPMAGWPVSFTTGKKYVVNANLIGSDSVSVTMRIRQGSTLRTSTSRLTSVQGPSAVEVAFINLIWWADFTGDGFISFDMVSDGGTDFAYIDDVSVTEESTGPSSAPGEGDFVYISDASTTHTYTVASRTDGGLPSGAVTTPVVVVSVSDTAIDSYSPGAKETANENFAWAGLQRVYGVDFDGAGNSWIDDFASDVRFYGCTLQKTAGSGSILSALSDRGVYIRAEDCTINGQGQLIDLFGNPYLETYRCTFGDYGTGLTNVLTNPGGSSGSKWRAYGCDFSAVSNYLITGGASWTLNKSIVFYFERCKLPTTWTGVHDVDYIRQYLHTHTMVGCSDTSAEEEYAYYWEGAFCLLTHDTAFYRDGSTAYPSGQKISLKCVVTADVDYWAPAIIPFPGTKYITLSDAAQDVVRLYMLSSSTLTDIDVYGVMHYADGTNAIVGNFVNSSSTVPATGSWTPDPFASGGTTLTTNTEAWTGRTTENRYHIDFDTTGDAGTDTVVSIELYVTKPSVTIYFCPTLGTL